MAATCIPSTAASQSHPVAELVQAPEEPVDVVSFEEAYPQYVSWCPHVRTSFYLGGGRSQIVNYRSAIIWSDLVQTILVFKRLFCQH